MWSDALAELEWFLNESRGSLGLRGQGWEAGGGGSESRLRKWSDLVRGWGLKVKATDTALLESVTFQDPGRRETAQAVRYRRCLLAWRQVTGDTRSVLADTYKDPHSGRRPLPARLKSWAERTADQKRLSAALKAWRYAWTAAGRADDRAHRSLMTAVASIR